MEACIKKPAASYRSRNFCQIFGLFLPRLTASWLFRWHKMFFIFSLFFSLKKDLYQNHTMFWIIGLTLHSCLTCLLSEMIGHVSVSSRSENWDVRLYVPKKRFDFWCRLQGSQVGEKTFFLMDMSIRFLTLKLIICSPLTLRFSLWMWWHVDLCPLTAHPVYPDPQDTVTPLGARVSPWSSFHVNSCIIGFSPKCF